MRNVANSTGILPVNSYPRIVKEVFKGTFYEIRYCQKWLWSNASH